VARGLIVAVADRGALWLALLGMGPAHPLWALLRLVGAAHAGGARHRRGDLANKFDQMAAITNFIVTPLSFLSGTFYSLEALPGWMQAISHCQPGLLPDRRGALRHDRHLGQLALAGARGLHRRDGGGSGALLGLVPHRATG
jgi:hypothetical protein